MSVMASVAAALVTSMMSGGGGTSGQQAQQMVDPFAAYRGQYGQQLNQLMQNPSSVASLPGYQAAEQAGSANLQRSMAATGQTQSGAEQGALARYGQQFQQSAFNDQYTKLAQLSGASAGPGAGGTAGVDQANLNSKNASQLGGAIGSAIGPGMSNTISSWFTPTNNPNNANISNNFSNAYSGSTTPGQTANYGAT